MNSITGNPAARNLSFDHLRILACFGVILLHASARLWYYLPVTSGDWLLSNCINITTRISVPLFVMISGALFLDPGHAASMKKLWQNHILRLGILYLLWMCVYGLHSFFAHEAAERTLKLLIKCVLTGRYHLWFLPMLMGLYALIPLLRTWLSNASKKEAGYFLLLFFIFQVLRTSISSFFVTPELLAFLDSFAWQTVCGYLGYFVLGYYLFYVGISDKASHVLISGIPLFYLGNVLISTVHSRISLKPQSVFFDSFGVLTFLTCIGVFQLFVRPATREGAPEHVNPALQKLVTEISKSTLGIYLMHLLVMESPLVSPLFDLLPASLSILTVSVVTFFICLIPSTLLRMIPALGRYLC